MVSSNAHPSLTTPLTTLLHINHPILLAGMAHTATAPLASAVTNAGGLGVIGGLGYTPPQLRAMIQELKSLLSSPTLLFGVDLALPAVGGTARKTNHDYTKGLLNELVDVIVDEGTTLFVSAVGVPPKHVVERLHTGGVVVMNMVGHPNMPSKLLVRAWILCVRRVAREAVIRARYRRICSFRRVWTWLSVIDRLC